MQVEPIPLDYEQDPERFRASVQSVVKYGLLGDVHESVAERLAAERIEPVLDLGCGEGRLVYPLCARGLSVVALDNSATMLSAVPGNRVRGDARRLPFRDGSFGAVAALYMLYHLPDPSESIAESYRVLRPDGIFLACAPSRYNDPELAQVLPPSPPATFDAENGPDMVGDFFQAIEIERWDAPLVHLPDCDALALYLRGRGLVPAQVKRVMECVSVPLTITKRGALVIGRKLP
jgi:SAM-dependent methyltransferase